MYSCGDDATSNDLDDSLMYNCTNDDIMEKFSLKTFRYFGADEGATVYIHCDLKVCLANEVNSACECPADPNACNGWMPGRKRRSLADSVDESQIYHVVSGPYTFEEEEVNKEEGKISFISLPSYGELAVL